MLRAFLRSFPTAAAAVAVLCLSAAVIGSSLAGFQLMHIPASAGGQQRLLPKFLVAASVSVLSIESQHRTQV